MWETCEDDEYFNKQMCTFSSLLVCWNMEIKRPNMTEKKGERKRVLWVICMFFDTQTQTYNQTSEFKPLVHQFPLTSSSSSSHSPFFSPTFLFIYFFLFCIMSSIGCSITQRGPSAVYWYKNELSAGGGGDAQRQDLLSPVLVFNLFSFLCWCERTKTLSNRCHEALSVMATDFQSTTGLTDNHLITLQCMLSHHNTNRCRWGQDLTVPREITGNAVILVHSNPSNLPSNLAATFKKFQPVTFIVKSIFHPPSLCFIKWSRWYFALQCQNSLT